MTRSEQRFLEELISGLQELLRTEGVRHEPTVESVYGKRFENIPRPNGCVFTRELRTALPGELFLEIDGQLSMQPSNGDLTTGPRLILRKCKRLVYDIIDEDRSPNKGQYASWGKTVILSDGGHTQAPYVLSEPRVEEG